MKIAIIIFALSLVFNSQIEITKLDLFNNTYKIKSIFQRITFLLMIGSFIAIILMY